MGLEGCEKFVLKFPPPILSSFLNSFPVVRKLNEKTETEVCEEYLAWRWKVHTPALGSRPEGVGSIARMRLMVMAQASGSQILTSYAALRNRDREVLNVELARTGISEQCYVCDPCCCSEGPTFLVYYAPAFLQKNGETEPKAALETLAEVLRQARVLWPAVTSGGNYTVSVRIDAIKELEIHTLGNLNPGQFWALERTSGVDGHVRKATVSDSDWKKLKALNLVTSNVTRELSVESDTKAEILPEAKRTSSSRLSTHTESRAKSTCWVSCCSPRLPTSRSAPEVVDTVGCHPSHPHTFQ